MPGWKTPPDELGPEVRAFTERIRRLIDRSGLSVTAVTVARARVGAAGVEVRRSAACSASWARITGAAPGDTVSVEVAGATERATVPEDADPAATGTDAYTPMLAVAPGAAARACGTLADGTGACTAGP
ncbi:DUF2690 domain-containing protein [Streptomyces sp. bgisy126]|uniref:DUF2690 domain-containing protein n=1 Tax=unclassified Streptomyces TaxID=2593676 RepID=UPI003EBAC3C4